MRNQRRKDRTCRGEINHMHGDGKKERRDTEAETKSGERAGNKEVVSRE